MKLLLDTQLLLWASVGSARLPKIAIARLEAPDAELVFSAASIWEVAIKSTLARAEFDFDANVLRRGLFDNGYAELAITGVHAAQVVALPPIHRDPFDRLLVAQAIAEGMTLVTVDQTLARYPGPVELLA